jgi:DNA-binding GntR family transcriptional regulator
MSGVLAPGEQLVEIPLAEWCDVSRTPIREALTRLEQDGLVQRGEHGLIVRESTPSEIIDLYESRIVLESKAAAVAAERRTVADLSNMRRAEDRYRLAAPDEVELLADYNRDFHRAIWVASHNNSLIDLLERLNMHLGRHPLTTLRFPGRHQTAAEEHRDCVTAIGDRDASGASKISGQHFAEAQEIRLKILEQR